MPAPNFHGFSFSRMSRSPTARSPGGFFAERPEVDVATAVVAKLPKSLRKEVAFTFAFPIAQADVRAAAEFAIEPADPGDQEVSAMRGFLTSWLAHDPMAASRWAAELADRIEIWRENSAENLR